MKMTNEKFNNLRFIVEVVGYIGVFIIAVSEILGFQYASQLSGIVGALGTLLGSLVIASRRKYNEDNGIEDGDDNE